MMDGFSSPDLPEKVTDLAAWRARARAEAEPKTPAQTESKQDTVLETLEALQPRVWSECVPPSPSRPAEPRAVSTFEEQARRQHRPLVLDESVIEEPKRHMRELVLEFYNHGRFSRVVDTAAAWGRTLSPESETSPSTGLIRVLPLLDLARFAEQEVTGRARVSVDDAIFVDLHAVERLEEVVVRYVTATRVLEIPLPTLLATANNSQAVTPELPLRETWLLLKMKGLAQAWQWHADRQNEEVELTRLSNETKPRARALGLPERFCRVIQYHLDPAGPKRVRSLPPRPVQAPVSLDARRQGPRSEPPLLGARRALEEVVFQGPEVPTERFWRDILGLSPGTVLHRFTVSELIETLERVNEKPRPRVPIEPPVGYTIVSATRPAGPGTKEVVELPLADALSLLEIPYAPGASMHRLTSLELATPNLGERLGDFAQVYERSGRDEALRDRVDRAIGDHRSLRFRVQVPPNPLSYRGETSTIVDLMP